MDLKITKIMAHLKKKDHMVKVPEIKCDAESDPKYKTVSKHSGIILVLTT